MLKLGWTLYCQELELLSIITFCYDKADTS